jgi:rod shape-determining protein MreD
MQWFRFAVFILIVTVLQASLVGIIAITNIKPDLLLILLVFFATHCNTSEAIITSFTIGFAADIIGSAMGPRIIGFGLFGTLLAYLHRVVAVRKMPYQSAVIFITGLLTGTLVHFLTLLKGQPTAPSIYATLFGTSLYSAIVGPFLFLPSAWCMRIKIHRFSRR